MQALAFYLLPQLFFRIGDAMTLMLTALPALTFLCALVYGLRHGIRDQAAFYALCTALLFLPTIYIYYNETAWIYVLVYGVLAFVGQGIGSIFHKKA